MRAWILLCVVALGCGEDEPEEVETVEPEARAPRQETPAPAPTPVSEEVHEAAAGAVGTPPAVGQWVRYRAHYRGGGEAQTEMAFTGREGDDWVFEVKDRRRRGETRFRMVLDLEGDAPELRALSTRVGDAPPQDVPARVLPQMRPVLAQWLAMLRPDFGDRPQESKTVHAGTFEGAYHGTEQIAYADRELEVEVWHHPSIPVTGMLLLEEQGGGGHRLELLAFGDSGAESAFD